MKWVSILKSKIPQWLCKFLRLEGATISKTSKSEKSEKSKSKKSKSKKCKV